jgi:1-acyl-sn-glycerol-3-phosphate acyltransferase
VHPAKQRYKASRLRLLWVQFLTAAHTAWGALSVIIAARSRNGQRQKIDSLLRRWSWALLRLTGMAVNVHNPHEVDLLDGRRYMLMCNHSSLYDIPLSFVALPGSIRMLTKKELFRIPLFGTGLRAGEFVSIDRSNLTTAMADLENARKKMESGIVLWVAPEGTRSKDGRLQPFKKGAIRLAIDMDAMIVPLGIDGINNVLPANTTDLYINGTVDVRVGEPIDAGRYDRSDYKKLMADLENSLRTLIRQPGVKP